MKRLTVLTLCCLVMGCSSVRSGQLATWHTIGNVTDTAITEYALSTGDYSEANPLMRQREARLAATVGISLIVWWVAKKHGDKPAAKSWLWVMTVMQWGVVGYNAAQIIEGSHQCKPCDSCTTFTF